MEFGPISKIKRNYFSRTKFVLVASGQEIGSVVKRFAALVQIEVTLAWVS